MIPPALAALRQHPPDLIAVGASAGAIDTLGAILPGLAAGFPAAIVIVVHIPATRPSALPELFARSCRLKMSEAEDKVVAEAGTVYFAPPDYHVLVERDRSLSLSADPPVQLSRPSIDVLFESVADGLRGRALGILLTGANADGAAGLARMRETGGLTWVEDPAAARYRAMPDAALALAPHATLTAQEMGQVLSEWGSTWKARP